MFGLGAVAIHQGLSIRLPAELVVTLPSDEIYRAVRAKVLRNNMFWILLLMVVPMAAYELIQQVSWLLPKIVFAISYEWPAHGVVLASWIAAAVALAMLAEYLVLHNGGQPYTWLLGMYSALLSCFLMLLYCIAMYSLPVTGVTALVVAVLLWLGTRRMPAEYTETIAGKLR